MGKTDGTVWRVCQWGLVLVSGFIVLSFILPSLEPHRYSRRTQCLNNVHNITLALINYHSAHGSFPPAFITDANGRPMNSWRLLILPYLDHNDLYAAVTFDEPSD